MTVIPMRAEDIEGPAQTIELVNGKKPPEPGQPWDRSLLSINVKQWTVRANIRNNIRRQLPQFRPYDTTSDHIIIVGGGWSLNHTIEELRELVFKGVKIVALNGAANWLVERNFRPSMHIILDALKSNLEFVKYDIPNCKYYIASQVNPALLDALEGRDVTMFHICSTDTELERKRLDLFYNKQWFPVTPAGTVGMVAIILLRSLGFKVQHLFGIDSCYDPLSGDHHAYPQPWNDPEGNPTFIIDGRPFMCSGWQASQCGEFIDLVNAMGDNLVLDIHGDGALAHLIKSGADRASIKQQEAKEA